MLLHRVRRLLAILPVVGCVCLVGCVASKDCSKADSSAACQECCCGNTTCSFTFLLQNGTTSCTCD